MQNEIADRLVEVLNVLGVSKNELSILAGYKGNSQIYRQTNKENPVSTQTILGLVNNYPQVVVDWIFTGKGRMFKPGYSPINAVHEVNEDEDTYQTLTKIKLVGLKQQGQYIMNFDYQDFLIDLPTITDGLSPTEFRDFESITSLSNNNINPSDVLRCHKRDVIKLFSKITSSPFVAVIVTTGNILIGEVSVRHDDLIVSLNDIKTTIPREDLNEVWEVKNIIKSV